MPLVLFITRDEQGWGGLASFHEVSEETLNKVTELLGDGKAGEAHQLVKDKDVGSFDFDAVIHG